MKFWKKAAMQGFTIPSLESDVYQRCYENSSCRVLDGKYVANKIKEQSKNIFKYQIKPCLAVILVGDDPASHIYVDYKVKFFKEIGFHSWEIKVNEDEASEEYLKNLIFKLGEDPEVHGILVQLPLPKHIKADNILACIPAHKDADGFHPENVGNLALGKEDTMYPCTPLGVMLLLSTYDLPLRGKNVTIIGKSNIVGKPLAFMAANEGATVTLAHSQTKDLKSACLSADILISATGVPELVKKEMVKPGAVVIDVGICRLSSGKLVGDVAYDVREVADALTPVPGGVGPLTISMLSLNTALLCKTVR